MTIPTNLKNRSRRKMSPRTDGKVELLVCVQKLVVAHQFEFVAQKLSPFDAILNAVMKPFASIESFNDEDQWLDKHDEA